MRELELDGIHDDGEHVILVDSDGERYTLRIDKALRAAVRRDRPALGMIQAADSAPVRPREIQSMLRSGRSAEDISEAADIPLEHVRRYEGPVLAEREWTAQRVRTFPVGRGGPSLDEVVAERLAAREATGETTWDAWRRGDGTWTLQLTFSAAGRTRQAHWVADLDNRSVASVDDEARWISDEDAPPEPTRGRARLQAVKSSVYDLEADGAFDENSAGPRRGRGRSSGQPSVSGDHPSAIDDGELDALNARRGLRSVPPPDDSTTVWASLDEDVTDEDEFTDGPDGAAVGPAEDAATRTSAPEGPRRVAVRDAADETGEDLEDSDREALLEHSASDQTTGSGARAAGSPDSVDPVHSDEADAAVSGGAEPAESALEADGAASAGEGSDGSAGAPVEYQDTVDLTPLPGFDDDASSRTPAEKHENDKSTNPSKPSKPAKSKSKRASMPSWDEIVFGSKHD
ncbi:MULTISPECIES: septation protein SepH [unclassified Brachybacterium]|uniref:septation protein SepH n=1 Tax=unclassified Brachybacterium TaxID=2623841 RepID=UPI00360C560D